MVTRLQKDVHSTLTDGFGWENIDSRRLGGSVLIEMHSQQCSITWPWTIFQLA